MSSDYTHAVKKRKRRFFYGWLVVAASFFVAAAAYGGAYSFGIFFKPLREDFGWTSAATSGAFSLYILFYCLVAPLSGWAVDRFGPRITIGLGGLFIGSGLLLTSQVNALWQIYLTYGLILGSGMSTAYGPMLTTVSRWFTKRRGLALGIVTAGIGAGILIISPLATYLISAYGWKLSYIILGPVVGAIVMIAALLLRKDPSAIGMATDGNMLSEISYQDKNSKDLEGNNIIRDNKEFSFGEAVGTKTFWLLCVMHGTTGFGLQIMLLHIVPYVQEGPKLHPMIAATVFSTIGVASIIGRLIAGAASDYIGRKMALAIATFIEGVMIIGLMSSSSASMLYLFAAVFGFGYGGHVPQFPALTGELFGLSRMGTILGTNAVFYGIGGALGVFLAGHIFDTTGSYLIAFSLAAITMILTAAIALLLKKPKLKEA
jgi:MFS family permease